MVNNSNNNNNDYIRLADILAKAFEDALAKHSSTADDYKSATKQKELLRELIKEISGSNTIPSFIGKIINDAVKEFSRDFRKQFESIGKQIEREYYNRNAEFIKYFSKGGKQTESAFANSNRERDNRTRGTGAPNLKKQTERLEILIDIVKNVGTRLTKANQILNKSSKKLSKAADNLAISAVEIEDSTNWIVGASKIIKNATGQLGKWQKHLVVNAVELEREASWSRAINRTVGKVRGSMKRSNNATLSKLTDPETDNKERNEKRSFADYLVEKLEKSKLGQGVRNVGRDFLRLALYQGAARLSKDHPVLAKGMMLGGAFLDDLLPMMPWLAMGAFKGGKNLTKFTKYFMDQNGLAYSMYGKGGLIGKLGDNLGSVGKLGRGLGIAGGVLGMGVSAYDIATAKNGKDRLFAGASLVGSFMMSLSPFLGPASPIVLAVGAILSFAKPIWDILSKIFVKIFGSQSSTGSSPTTNGSPRVPSTSGYSGAVANGSNHAGRTLESDLHNLNMSGGKKVTKQGTKDLLKAVQNNKAYEKIGGEKGIIIGSNGSITLSGINEGVPYARKGTQHILQSMLNNPNFKGGNFNITSLLGGPHTFKRNNWWSHWSGQKIDFQRGNGDKRTQEELARSLLATGLFEIDLGNGKGTDDIAQAGKAVHPNASGNGRYHVDLRIKDSVYEELAKQDTKKVVKAIKGEATKSYKDTSTLNPSLNRALTPNPNGGNAYKDTTSDFSYTVMRGGVMIPR